MSRLQPRDLPALLVQSPAGGRVRAALAVGLVVCGVLSGIIVFGDQKVVISDARPQLVSLGGGLPEGIAYRIGDDVTTETELATSVAVLKGLYGIREPEDGRKADDFRRDVTKAVVVSAVLARQAADRGIEVSEDQVEEQLVTLVQSAYGGDRDAFVSTLADKGVSEDDVRAEIRNQLQNLQLFTDVTADVEQPESAVARAYYAEHSAEMVAAERRTLSNIVVASKEEAQEILGRLRRGQRFATLARSFSLDGQTQQAGGDLGALTLADLEKAYGTAAFAARPGLPFGPVKTESGWNIGVVRSVTPERKLSFAEMEDTIKAVLLDDARQQSWSEFISDALRRADVEYADSYRPADPTAPPSDELGLPTDSPVVEED